MIKLLHMVDACFDEGMKLCNDWVHKTWLSWLIAKKIIQFTMLKINSSLKVYLSRQGRGIYLFLIHRYTGYSMSFSIFNTVVDSFSQHDLPSPKQIASCLCMELLIVVKRKLYSGPTKYWDSPTLNYGDCGFNWILLVVETTCIKKFPLLDMFMKNCLFGIWFNLQAIVELQ